IMPWFLPYQNNQSGMHETAQTRQAYRIMMASPHVKASVLGKLLGVAGLELKILPVDKKNARDREIAEGCQWILGERIRGGFPGMAWSILSGAAIDGYSINEKVWAIERKGRWA